MEFTGERVIPGQVEPDLFNEHICRYYFATPLVAGKVVLDLGCGSGYGAFELAKQAGMVLGLDMSPQAIDFARRNYVSPNLSYLVGDCCQTGLAPSSFDAVICFEVIEHLAEQPRLMEEICRILKPSGFLLISTPNRLFYTEEQKQRNPFHTHEFDYDEFSGFLRRYFGQVNFCCQNHIDSIFVGDPLKPAPADTIIGKPAQQLPATANFFLALCATQATQIPKVANLVYAPQTSNLLRAQRLCIDDLEKRLAARESAHLKLQQEFEERTQWAHALDQQLNQRDECIRSLQDDVLKKNQWAHALDQQLKQRDERIRSLQDEVEEKNQWARSLGQQLNQQNTRLQQLQDELAERTDWACRLDAELVRCRNLRSRRIYKLATWLRLLPKWRD